MLEAIHKRLGRIEERLTHMALDVSKIAASEEHLKTAVEALAAINTKAQADLADLKTQLAAAIAANDPAALAAAQATLDALAADMDAETAKITPAPAAPPAAPAATG